MRQVRLMTAAALAIAVSGCAGEKLWMKRGAGPGEANADEMSCAEESESRASIVIGDGLGPGFGPATDRFSQRFACLRSRGYRLVTITPEESARLKSLGGIEREAYWSELQRKYGVAL